MSKTPVIPTIHLNGSSRGSIVSALERAVESLRVAESALAETAPNARDYYTQGDGAFAAANLEHVSRIQRVRAVREEIFTIWEAVEDGNS